MIGIVVSSMALSYRGGDGDGSGRGEELSAVDGKPLAIPSCFDIDWAPLV
jgi:hypothetical protein